jgi:putative DNA primase/helicase
MLTFETAVAALPGGRFEGERYRAPCPAHRGKGRNLSVWADKNGNACFKCWSGGCATRDIVSALGAAPAERAPRPKTPGRKLQSEEQRIAAALEYWRRAKPPEGTIVQDYLFGRGWTGELPAAWRTDSRVSSQIDYSVGLALPASIRFHPSLTHPSGACLPAMVAAIEDRDARIVGVHRTFLKPDGTGKAEVEPNKMALGKLKGCAVHLTAGAPELVLCEGIETGLAILQATGRHVWAALGTANLGQVELPGFVREVIIAADNDDPGLKAARVAADSYAARQYQVRIVSPRSEGWDFNDAAEAVSGGGRRQRF